MKLLSCLSCKCICRADVTETVIPPSDLKGSKEKQLKSDEGPVIQKPLERKFSQLSTMSSLYYFDAQEEIQVVNDDNIEKVELDLDTYFDAFDISEPGRNSNYQQRLEPITIKVEDSGFRIGDADSIDAADEALLAPEYRNKEKRCSPLQLPLQLPVPKLTSAKMSEDWGFPGSLTYQELRAYKQLRAEIKRRGGIYEEMLSCYREIEDESYSLCRYLRNCRFHVADVLKFMDAATDAWVEAKRHDFYPDAQDAVGAPLSVLLTQFPQLYHGYSKDGYPLCFFYSGHLSVEGVECITSLERLPNILWHTLMHEIVDIHKKARAANPSLTRLEQITVMNLDGLSASFFTPRTYAVVNEVDIVAQIFPELLHKLVIINAPSFFTIAWAAVKRFLDPNTVKRIEIYSSGEKGTKRLLELIDKSELPSDYGGLAMSTPQRILQEGRKEGDPVPHRRMCELMTMKRRHAESSFNFDLDANERMCISIYTRSTTDSHFTLHSSDNRSIILEKAIKNKKAATPFCVNFADDLEGPGQFTLLGKLDKHMHSAMSSENFLVIGEVFKID